MDNSNTEYILLQPENILRDCARKKINRFVEVMIRCPLSICIDRESSRSSEKITSQLYKKALERKEKGIKSNGLGEVVGIDMAYEDNPNAEIVIESDTSSASGHAIVIKNALIKYFNLINCRT